MDLYSTLYFNSAMSLLCMVTYSVWIHSSVDYSDRCNGVHNLQIQSSTKDLCCLNLWMHTCLQKSLFLCCHLLHTQLYNFQRLTTGFVGLPNASSDKTVTGITKKVQMLSDHNVKKMFCFSK